jgi:hypothetical protein
MKDLMARAVDAGLIDKQGNHTTKIICAKMRPEGHLFRNWPNFLYCTEPPEHTGEHKNTTRIDGVEYAWEESDYALD